MNVVLKYNSIHVINYLDVKNRPYPYVLGNMFFGGSLSKTLPKAGP